MIDLYTDIKKKYIGIIILGLFIFIMISILIIIKTNKYIFIPLLITFSIVYVIIIRLLCLKKAVSRLNNLSLRASGNSGLRDCIKEYEALLDNAKDQRIKTLLLNNITGLYTNIGELDKAMKMYDNQSPTFDSTPLGVQNRIIYIYNICEISIRKGIYFHARSNLALMNALMDDKRFSNEQRTNIEKIHSDVVVWLVFAEDEIKDYETIEKYYLKRFNEESNIAAQVFFAYQLSKVYKKLKNKKLSKEYLDFYNENKCELNYEW